MIGRVMRDIPQQVDRHMTCCLRGQTYRMSVHLFLVYWISFSHLVFACLALHQSGVVLRTDVEKKQYR